MASPFLYRAYSVLSWEPLDPLPYSQVSFGQSVNASASFSGQLVLTDPKVQAMAWDAATVPGATALFVDYLGQIVWGGMVYTCAYTESANPKVMTVTAQTFNEWAAQRLQVFDYSTTWQDANATDPTQIVSQFVHAALGSSFSGENQGANFGMPINVIVNGGPAPAVSVTYPGTQLQSIDSMMNTLSQMGYGAGFDYSWDCAYNAQDIPEVTLNIWFPRQGQHIGPGAVVVHKAKCLDYSYTEDATQQADSVFVTGSTTSGSGGTSPVEGVATSVIAEGWPLLEQASSHVQINDEEVLIEVAAGLLAQNAYPVVTPTITLAVPYPNPAAFPNQPGFLDPSAVTFGDFVLGDDLEFIIDAAIVNSVGQQVYGINASPRFPKGLQFTFRIIGWTCTVADVGVSTILLDLATPPLESFPPPPPPH